MIELEKAVETLYDCFREIKGPCDFPTKMLFHVAGILGLLLVHKSFYFNVKNDVPILSGDQIPLEIADQLQDIILKFTGIDLSKTPEMQKKTVSNDDWPDLLQ